MIRATAMIYLDHNATTAPLSEVVDAVSRTLAENWGNPSSTHALGRKAKEALEGARDAVAGAFGVASPSGLTFTASGTESIHLAFAWLLGPGVSQILVCESEHSAVLSAARRWSDGRQVTLIPVNARGIPDLEFIRRESNRLPSLVSVAMANNETGVIADMEAISAICRDNRAVLHVDAVQAAGKIPVHMEAIGCAAASLSSHKFHGPPGVGILYLDAPRDTATAGYIPTPGRQEGGLRGGTENLPAIVGCGVAAGLIGKSLAAMPAIGALRDWLESTLLETIPGAAVHGGDAPRLPNTINLYCPRRSAADLVQTLSRLGLAASAGAACSSGRIASHVIRAMGFPEERANGSLRLSLGCATTEAEVRAAAGLLEKAFHITPPTTG